MRKVALQLTPDTGDQVQVRLFSVVQAKAGKDTQNTQRALGTQNGISGLELGGICAGGCDHSGDHGGFGLR